MRNLSNIKRSLIVEGNDDQYTIIHLTEKHGIDWTNQNRNKVQISNARSCNEALKMFPITIKSAEYVGIVLDADLDLSNRWQAVCDRLKSVIRELDISIDLPDKPDPKGTIIKFGDQRVGIWLMPDNEQNGKLEDFLKTLVPVGDCCWNYAGQVTQQAQNQGALFSSLDTIKAHVHTWLAWQEKPGLPYGTAIKAAYFLHDTPEAHTFVNWFKQLFFG